MGKAFGPYELTHKLADGGMGEVYLAEKAGPGGWKFPVVIKRILPPFADQSEFVRQMDEEAKVVAQLSHPNIVRIIDYTEIDDFFCLILEHVPGLSAKELLDRHGPLGEEAVGYILSELLLALSHAHSRTPAIIHQDVSPPNILCSLEGMVKLTDFGIAYRPRKERDINLGMWGRPAYLAPELLQGGRASPQSDLFAVGAVGYELFSGKSLFSHELEERQGERRRPPKAVKRLPISPEIRAILLRALSDHPMDRFENAEAMRGALLKQLSLDWLYHGQNKFQAMIHQVAGSRISQGSPVVPTARMVSSNPKGRFGLTVGLGLIFLILLSFEGSRWTGKDMPPPANDQGELYFDSNPWSYVFIDGQEMGSTPLNRVILPAGNHTIHTLDPFGATSRHQVEILPETTTERFVKLGFVSRTDQEMLDK